MDVSAFVLAAFLNGQSGGEPFDCVIESVSLALNSPAAEKCQAQELEGRYTISLCAKGTGSFESENGNSRILFKTSEGWMARQDTMDLTNGVTISDVLVLDENLSHFRFIKSVSRNNGTPPAETVCSGVISR